MPTRSSATVTATSGMPTAIARKLVPMPLMPAAARLPSSSGKPRQYRGERLRSHPEDRREHPARQRPARDDEDGQREHDHRRAGERRREPPGDRSGRRASRPAYPSSSRSLMPGVDPVDDEHRKRDADDGTDEQPDGQRRRAQHRRARRRASRRPWCRAATRTRWRESAASWARRRPSEPEHTTPLVTVDFVSESQNRLSSLHGEDRLRARQRHRRTPDLERAAARARRALRPRRARASRVSARAAGRARRLRRGRGAALRRDP